ncbi:hypothetical protein OP10G_1857 [Fimbriimonas ginsengisoli Gsoil 348]|uniref:Transposase IS200-like domain-containing protein n=2 Tax=Fimbriimonas ginsengisoli TaxID=1005039 RepID=A0A068NR41_FIMGI|nr:hypothetical protein OP10G_1857 [Fimbriimonas ginsengisoli Gsoil 348]
MGWQVQAWAVFSNHYHFVGFSPDEGLQREELTQRIHRNSARAVNALDGVQGRQVWYRCWDTRLTYEKSYLARLAYVHSNPVKHGLVADASTYRWCSARWFRENTEDPFFRTVMSFKTDNISIYDDFD